MLLPAELDGYECRRVPGARSAKEYVCPGCGNPIPTGTGHVVAWPTGEADRRRHWHDHCWRIVARRGRIA